MSDFIEAAASELNDKMSGQEVGGSVKFAVEGAGSIMLDDSGARVGDDAADVTFNADEDTFRQIFDGDMNPTAAFMSGKLTIDGDMGLAMKLAAVMA